MNRVQSTNSSIHPWMMRGRSLHWGQRTYLMGVLNITPDSFSDGGQFNTLTAAIAQAHHLAASGADILDIGGESTRPQADPVSPEEEWQRVVPVIQALRRGFDRYPPLEIPISIDTTRAAVAQAAIEAGADLINDVSGGTQDEAMLPTAARLEVPIVLMHRRGTPKTMQQLTEYGDLMGELCQVLQESVARAIASGIPGDRIALDPGIGFAKTLAQNLEILRQIPQLRALGHPILIGTSRKSFIGHILHQPDPQQRVWGTAATCCAAIAGAADILRVHDVAEMRQVCQVADAIWRP